MVELRNIGISLVIFAMIIGLLVTSFNGVKEAYDLTDTYTKKGKNIGDALNDLEIMKGMNKTISGAYTLGTPTADLGDILGAIQSLGLGVLQTIAGVITTPIRIIVIFVSFYPIPTALVIGSITLLTTIIGFILLSKYLRDRV